MKKRKLDEVANPGDDVVFHQQLPTELLPTILQFLQVPALVALSCVNRYLREEIFRFAKHSIKQIYSSRCSESNEMKHNELKNYLFISDWRSKNTLYILHYLTFGNFSKNFKVDIACGIGHTIVLDRLTGRTYSCGEGCNGQLGNGSSRPVGVLQEVAFPFNQNEEKIVSVKAGTFYSAFVTNRSRVFMTGEDPNWHLDLRTDESKLVPTLVWPSGLKVKEKAISIACGTTYSLILTGSGKVLALGKNKFGALGLGNSCVRTKRLRLLRNQFHGERIIDVVASTFHSMFVTEGGSLFSCGMGKYGCLGYYMAENVFAPRLVEYFAEKNVKIIAASIGSYHSICLSTAGKVYSFGKASGGRLGHGMVDGNQLTEVPRKLQLPFVVHSVVAGETHSLILSADGKAYTFGVNTYGKLGQGDEEDRYYPEEVKIYERPGKEGLIRIASNELFIVKGQIGDWHTILTTDTGIVFTCGGGWFGRLGLGLNQHDNVNRPRLCVFK